MGRKARLKRKRRHGSRSEITVVDSPRGLPSVSGALADLAQPLIDEVGPDAELDDVEPIFRFVVAVWNIGSLAVKAPNAASRLRSELEPEAHGIFDALLEARQTAYPDDHRIVTHFQVAQQPNEGFHLIAASVFSESDKAQYGIGL